MLTHQFYKAIIALAIFASLALLTQSPPAQKAEAEIPETFITVMAEVTSYSSDTAETDDTPFITANGSRVHDGTIACPRHIAFGTVVEIAGKEYVCEDRMNLRFPDRWDVWSPSKEAATDWGVKVLPVKIKK